MKFNICPLCLKKHKSFCKNCNSNISSTEIKQNDKIYEIKTNIPANSNVYYITKHLETTWNLNKALGDTILEKNESLFLKMIDVRNKLGGEIHKIVCSPKWWSDFWIIFKDGIFTSAEGDDLKYGKLVGMWLGKTNVYTSDLINAKYWVYLECPYGNAIISIKYKLGLSCIS